MYSFGVAAPANSLAVSMVQQEYINIYAVHKYGARQGGRARRRSAGAPLQTVQYRVQAVYAANEFLTQLKSTTALGSSRD